MLDDVFAGLVAGCMSKFLRNEKMSPQSLNESPPEDGGKKEVKPPLSGHGFLGLVSFSTILPLNVHSTIQEMARFTSIWPIIGGFIGIIAGCFGWLLLYGLHLSPLLSAGTGLQFSHWFNWFPHLDGWLILVTVSWPMETPSGR